MWNVFQLRTARINSLRSRPIPSRTRIPYTTIRTKGFHLWIISSCTRIITSSRARRILSRDRCPHRFLTSGCSWIDLPGSCFSAGIDRLFPKFSFCVPRFPGMPCPMNPQINRSEYDLEEAKLPASSTLAHRSKTVVSVFEPFSRHARGECLDSSPRIPHP